MLTAYADVFSSGEVDVERTNLAEHWIPVNQGITPIRQPPRRLNPEKYRGVDDQLQSVVRQGLVKPGDGAWSSPVVLDKKEDQIWCLCID